MAFNTMIIWLNVALMFWAIFEVDSAARRVDVSLSKAQAECRPYFDEINKGSGA